MKKALLGVLAVIFVCSGLAIAGEGNWSGFYFGLNAGLARHEPNWSDNGYDWFGGTLTNPYCTFLPGVAVGFNIQNGSIVFGLEADAAIGFTENVTEYSYYYWGTPQFDVTKTDKLGFLATLRGRVGFAVDNALFYMTAGAGLPSAAHTWIEDDDVPDSWQTFHNSKLGMVVGLGFEHRLGQKFAIKVEYLHFANLPVVQPNAQTHPYYMSVDEKVGILRLGFNILF
ncbi:MAG: hypothetical protein A2Y56_08640 [Candidatus Aminicenantes bacterium RBG_13_63_10]|nr:MAG: hypothetical protein A2Y56_08640 [Candidatus Aminicenantes bacterium RBG_13_63_10]